MTARSRRLCRQLELADAVVLHLVSFWDLDFFFAYVKVVTPLWDFAFRSVNRCPASQETQGDRETETETACQYSCAGGQHMWLRV